MRFNDNKYIATFLNRCIEIFIKANGPFNKIDILVMSTNIISLVRRRID